MDVGARQKARHFAVQALYQWILADAKPAQIEAEFRVDNDMRGVDLEYFHEMLFQVVAQSHELDTLFDRHLDRQLQELDPVSLAQLRMSTYELKSRIDVPWRVVIDEAVRLSKKFGPTDSYKYLNGVLDKLAHELRPAETATKR
ncbi:MAG TPA: transcription antitermination factor NusB [Pseudomonadales bacterium]|nr:transcription antitermination factor NusB [Pseudomonadales bacterium]